MRGPGGSRGKVRRMRAGPVVPVELVWRRGRDNWFKLAGIEAWRERVSMATLTLADARTFFGSAVKRRGGQNNLLYSKRL